MSTHLSPDQINAAINTAARQMTSAAPSSDLRARVMSRIDVSDATRPRWGWRLAIAGGAIATLVAIAATYDLGGRFASPTETGVSVAGKTTPEVVHPTNPTAATVPSSPVLSTASVQRIASRSTAFEVSAAELEWRARAVQALDEVAALTVDPLEQSGLSINPIDITPLSVAPLTVPAIGSSGSK